MPSGVPPQTLLDARGFRSLAGEVAAALTRHPDATPDPAAVAEYLRFLNLCWATRFAADEGGDERE